MKQKITIVALFVIFPVTALSLDFGNIDVPVMERIARDDVMIREAREIAIQQYEIREQERNFIDNLTKKIERLENQVEKQQKVINTYENIVALLKAELEKERDIGK